MFGPRPLHSRILFTLNAVCLAGIMGAQSEEAFPRDQVEFFENEIRPLLADRCYDCHGADRHENGLRLDQRSALLRGSDYGPVVISGDPAGSKLVKAIKHAPGVEAMPKKGDALTPVQIANVERWIGLGLPWPDEAEVAEEGHSKADPTHHWAFQPVQKPAIPPTPALIHNPIDAFVATKLDAAGLDFAPSAEASDLCRRIHLTLTGLQPDFASVQAFIAEHSKNPQQAIQSRVTELLASEHYGQRWARHWLDVARYSDTEGYTAGGRDNRFPHSYTYRNWVINALNADMPYDQFVRNQLAADRLLPEAELVQASLNNATPNPKPKPELRNLAALGFLTVNDRFLGDRVLQTDDRIDVVGRGLLGLTIACARCHDHKYDPIPSQDYYSLYGVFNSSTVTTDEAMPIIGQPDSSDAVEAFRKANDEIEQRKQAFREEVMEDLRQPDRLADYLLFAQKHLNTEPALFKGTAGKEKMRDRIAERWRDFLKKSAMIEKPHPVMLAWKRFAETPANQLASKAPEIIAALKGDAAISNQIIVDAFAKKSAPKSMTEVAITYGEVFVSHVSAEPMEDKQRESIRALLAGGSSPMSITTDKVDSFFTRKDRDQMTKLDNEVKKLEISSPGAPFRAMAMVDNPKPVDQKIMIRGSPGRLGDPAPRAYLTFFGGEKFTDGSGRLELADRIASKDNPLTARVMVNRVWMHHFGKPLVSQPSDFGVQTPRPLHAELLDFLASTFMEEGWSLKKLHHLILSSRTWQQSCQSSTQKDETDAENELLSRMNRQRLDYETLRDNLLLVSGTLNPSQAPGRPVPLNAPNVDTWRSIALLVDRYEQPTVPAMFDFANPDSHTPQRFVTTVPQQALFLMNSPFMKTHSEGLARRLPVEGSVPDSGTIRHLYNRVFLRNPTPDEVESTQRFLSDAAEMQPIPSHQWSYGTVELEKGENGQMHLGGWKPFKVLDRKSNRWSHTGKIPDPVWSYAYLGSTSGHAGKPTGAPAIRWTAPATMTIRLSGTLERQSEHGNGVGAWISHSRTGPIRHAIARPKEKVSLSANNISVQKGDVITLAFDAIDGETNHDTFHWTLAVYEGDTRLTDAKADFCGPDGWPLAGRVRRQPALAQLAQVLMMSNEFQFVD